MASGSRWTHVGDRAKYRFGMTASRIKQVRRTVSWEDTQRARSDEADTRMHTFCAVCAEAMKQTPLESVYCVFVIDGDEFNDTLFLEFTDSVCR